jgi:hypothetical protein
MSDSGTAFKVDFSEPNKVILFRSREDGASNRIDLTYPQAVTLAKAILVKLNREALKP